MNIGGINIAKRPYKQEENENKERRCNARKRKREREKGKEKTIRSALNQTVQTHTPPFLYGAQRQPRFCHSHLSDYSVLNMYSSKPSRPKPLQWSTSSHLSVFVRNLQFLNLHHHQDWPGISVRALSPSSQNQRQRVRAVEWALYHLCAIWDPEVTQDVCTYQSTQENKTYQLQVQTNGAS